MRVDIGLTWGRCRITGRLGLIVLMFGILGLLKGLLHHDFAFHAY